MKTNMNMMKSILMVLVVGALVCSSCKDGDDANGSGTQPCTCLSTYGTTAHLGMNETCTCGGTDCNCTAKVYGNIAGVPIYRQKNVTELQAVSATNNASAGYAGISDEVTKGKINPTNLSRIEIIGEGYADCLPDVNNNGKYILYLEYDRDVNGMMEDIYYYADTVLE